MSRLACLANFAETLGFISKKGSVCSRYPSFRHIPAVLSRFLVVPGQKTLSGC